MVERHDTDGGQPVIGDLAALLMLVASFAVGVLIVLLVVGALAPRGDEVATAALFLGWFGPVPLWFWILAGDGPRRWTTILGGVLLGGPTAIGYVVLMAIWMLLKIFGELLSGLAHF